MYSWEGKSPGCGKNRISSSPADLFEALCLKKKSSLLLSGNSTKSTKFTSFICLIDLTDFLSRCVSPDDLSLTQDSTRLLIQDGIIDE